MIEQFIQWSHYTGYRPVISSCRTQYIFALCFCVVYLCLSWLCDFCFALVCHLTISLCLCVLYFVQPCFADPALRLCDVQHVQQTPLSALVCHLAISLRLCVLSLCIFLCSLCVTHNMCNRSPCLAALVAQGCSRLVSVFFSRLIMYIIGPGGGLLQNTHCQQWVNYGENQSGRVKVSPFDCHQMRSRSNPLTLQ